MTIELSPYLNGRRKTLKDKAKTQWRLLGADLFSRVTFSVSSGMMIEIFIAGMAVMQSVYSRAVNTPIVMLTARPYGIFRDWVLRKANIQVDAKGKPLKGHKVRYILTNQLAYAAFFCPQYALVLWLEGATWPQIWKAAGTVAVTSPILGALFGYWMDFVRARIFKVHLQHEPSDPEKDRS